MEGKELIGNLLRGASAIVNRRLGWLTSPRFLWFGVTDQCNSRCSTCNIWRMTPCDKPLVAADVDRILRTAPFEKIEYIINSGGEPSMRSDLKQILHMEYKTKPKARIQLSTNGILAECVLDVVGFMVEENGIGLDVGISLDGIGEKHDVVRGVKGNFEAVDWLLHELKEMQKKHDLNITVGSTLTVQTAENYRELLEYSRKMGVPFMFHWFNQSNFYGNMKKKENNGSDMESVVEASMPCSLYRDMWIQSLETGKIPRFRCFALNSFMVLKCNGDIAPCLSLWNSVAGNIRDEKYPSCVWHSERAKAIRKVVKNCSGCLNSWGVNWSLRTSYIPLLVHEVKRRLRNAN